LCKDKLTAAGDLGCVVVGLGRDKYVLILVGGRGRGGDWRCEGNYGDELYPGYRSIGDDSRVGGR